MPERPRFSIRPPHWGWILLVTAVVAFGGIGLSIWLPYQREQGVIRQVEGWGGHVATEACVPSWCESIVGKSSLRIFQRVTEVHLIGGRVQNEDLNIFQNLPSLRVLDVSDTEVDDEGCARLARLAPLEQLYIDLTPVTDAGMNHLASLKGLRVLYIHGTKVSDRGVEALRHVLPDLKIDR